MKQITRWSPDTCGCVIEYEWDGTLPESDRIHTVKRITRCEHHQRGSDEDVFTRVLDENRRKNRVLEILQSVKPDIDLDNYNWSFDKDRVLKAGIIGIALTEAERGQIKNQCGKLFNTGKAQMI